MPEPKHVLTRRYVVLMILLTGLSLIVPVMILIGSSTHSDVMAWRMLSVLPLQLCFWIAWIVGAVYGVVKYVIVKARRE
jgi:hypothetical protein